VLPSLDVEERDQACVETPHASHQSSREYAPTRKTKTLAEALRSLSELNPDLAGNILESIEHNPPSETSRGKDKSKTLNSDKIIHSSNTTLTTREQNDEAGKKMMALEALKTTSQEIRSALTIISLKGDDGKRKAENEQLQPPSTTPAADSFEQRQNEIMMRLDAVKSHLTSKSLVEGTVESPEIEENPSVLTITGLAKVDGGKQPGQVKAPASLEGALPVNRSGTSLAPTMLPPSLRTSSSIKPSPSIKLMPSIKVSPSIMTCPSTKHPQGVTSPSLTTGSHLTTSHSLKAASLVEASPSAKAATTIDGASAIKVEKPSASDANVASSESLLVSETAGDGKKRRISEIVQALKFARKTNKAYGTYENPDGGFEVDASDVTAAAKYVVAVALSQELADKKIQMSLDLAEQGERQAPNQMKTEAEYDAKSKNEISSEGTNSKVEDGATPMTEIEVRQESNTIILSQEAIVVEISQVESGKDINRQGTAETLDIDRQGTSDQTVDNNKKAETFLQKHPKKAGKLKKFMQKLQQTVNSNRAHQKVKVMGTGKKLPPINEDTQRVFSDDDDLFVPNPATLKSSTPWLREVAKIRQAKRNAVDFSDDTDDEGVDDEVDMKSTATEDIAVSCKADKDLSFSCKARPIGCTHLAKQIGEAAQDLRNSLTFTNGLDVPFGRGKQFNEKADDDPVTLGAGGIQEMPASRSAGFDVKSMISACSDALSIALPGDLSRMQLCEQTTDKKTSASEDARKPKSRDTKLPTWTSCGLCNSEASEFQQDMKDLGDDVAKLMRCDGEASTTCRNDDLGDLSIHISESEHLAEMSIGSSRVLRSDLGTSTFDSSTNTAESEFTSLYTPRPRRQASKYRQTISKFAERRNDEASFNSEPTAESERTAPSAQTKGGETLKQIAADNSLDTERSEVTAASAASRHSEITRRTEVTQRSEISRRSIVTGKSVATGKSAGKEFSLATSKSAGPATGNKAYAVKSIESATCHSIGSESCTSDEPAAPSPVTKKLPSCQTKAEREKENGKPSHCVGTMLDDSSEDSFAILLESISSTVSSHGGESGGRDAVTTVDSAKYSAKESKKWFW